MNSACHVILNGAPHAIPSVMPLSQLLESIGFHGKPVVVELNQEAIFPRDYASTMVKSGSKIEIVALAAGG